MLMRSFHERKGEGSRERSGAREKQQLYHRERYDNKISMKILYLLQEHVDGMLDINNHNDIMIKAVID